MRRNIHTQVMHRLANHQLAKYLVQPITDSLPDFVQPIRVVRCLFELFDLVTATVYLILLVNLSFLLNFLSEQILEKDLINRLK